MNLEAYRKKLSLDGTTVGETVKNHSDMVMEVTWDRDLQSKTAYIYDYFHDDSPLLKDHITYDNTTKTKIDIKFIVTQYPTVSKDQVEYHIQFKPSQSVEFVENDELFYFEKEYRDRYFAEFPIGMYIDIPNEKKQYEKWLIVAKDDGNQFPKYSVLKCNYEFMWIEQNHGKRIKRRMWSVLRNQNSYKEL